MNFAILSVITEHNYMHWMQRHSDAAQKYANYIVGPVRFFKCYSLDISKIFAVVIESVKMLKFFSIEWEFLFCKFLYSKTFCLASELHQYIWWVCLPTCDYCCAKDILLCFGLLWTYRQKCNKGSKSFGDIFQLKIFAIKYLHS